MNKETLNSIYERFAENQHTRKNNAQLLDTPEGHIVATATLNVIRDYLKFRLNGKIEKAKNEVLNHNNFAKCEYYLGVNDTAIEILTILDRLEI